VLEAERLERVGDQIDHAPLTEVRLRVHRQLVRAERQVEQHAASVLREDRHQLPPDVRVYEQPVDEDDGRAATQLEVAEWTGGEIEFPRAPEPRVSPPRLSSHNHVMLHDQAMVH
jgi:hypothetical protein